MNPMQILLILRYRYRVALLVAMLVISAGAWVYQKLPKRFAAEAEVMVDVRQPDPIAALFSPSGIHPGTMATQVDIVRSKRVARKVVRMLGLDENPAVVQLWQESTGGRGKVSDWMAERLQAGLRVTPSRESNIVSIGYEGADPAFVAGVANAYARAYVEASVELKVEPAREYAHWFQEQSKVLRENVEKAQARLSAFQRAKGIVATNESLDHEMSKLGELSARLTAVQAETREAQSKQRSSGNGAAATLPEVLGNAVIQGLRSQIVEREVRLKEAGGNLGTRHPQYLRLESELAELKNKLAAETRHIAGAYSTSTAVGKAKESELQAAIEAQKQKLFRLRVERDEIAVLLRDVETAKRAYESVPNRYHQAALEAQATQTNVSLLTPATEPLDPSFPRQLEEALAMLVALGLVLGSAAALGLEMIDRRVRSADELAEMLQVPVLAVIERGSRRKRLRARGGIPALPAPSR